MLVRWHLPFCLYMIILGPFIASYRPQVWGIEQFITTLAKMKLARPQEEKECILQDMNRVYAFCAFAFSCFIAQLSFVLKKILGTQVVCAHAAPLLDHRFEVVWLGRDSYLPTASLVGEFKTKKVAPTISPGIPKVLFLLRESSTKSNKMTWQFWNLKVGMIQFPPRSLKVRWHRCCKGGEGSRETNTYRECFMYTPVI